jgi:hypothetical protein
LKRANEGRAAARKRGVHMGRKPKLTELQRRVARERIAKGESARIIAQEWGGAWLTPPWHGRSYRKAHDRTLVGRGRSLIRHLSNLLPPAFTDEHEGCPDRGVRVVFFVRIVHQRDHNAAHGFGAGDDGVGIDFG